MRPIKFRAWDKREKKMWKAGFYLFMTGKTMTFLMDSEDGPNECLLDEFELMQFTGLLDKHGKEIYEGDLLYPFSNTAPPLPVEFFDGHWELHFYKAANSMVHRYCPWLKSTMSSQMAIVGNIYENPELLK